MSLNLEEYNGVYFSESTPTILRDVILDCIGRKVMVHILTGDPLSGVITPKLNSVGYVGVSDGSTPQPVFKTRSLYTTDGHLRDTEEYRSYILPTERVLRVNEVDTCALLYQSYECKSTALEYIHEVHVSPYGDIDEQARILCKNPECELFVPASVDFHQLCDFLFGRVHYLPGLFDNISKND